MQYTITIADAKEARVNAAIQKEYPGYAGATIPDPAWTPTIPDPNNAGQTIPNPTPQPQIANPVTPREYTRKKTKEWLLSRVALHEGEEAARVARAAAASDVESF